MSPAPLLYMAQSAARGGKREKMKTRGGCSDLKGAKRRGDLIKGPIRRKWWIFLLPMIAAFAIGFVWPFIQGIYLSFCKFTTTSDAKLLFTTGGGIFDNYAKALKDASFVHSFWYTALFAIVSLIIINILAFTAAYFLTQGIKALAAESCFHKFSISYME